jgi:hypothetical protein
VSLLGDLARAARKGQRALRDAQRVVDAVEGAAVNLRGVAAGIEHAVALVEGGAAQTRGLLAAADKAVGRATRPAPVTVAARVTSPAPTRPSKPSPAPQDSADEVVEAEVIDFGVGPRSRL